MGRKPWDPDKIKPPFAAMRALDDWLHYKGLPAGNTLAPLWDSTEAYVTLLFKGQGTLTEQARQAVEKLTDGVITAAMLAGHATTPTTKSIRRSLGVPEIQPFIPDGLPPSPPEMLASASGRPPLARPWEKPAAPMQPSVGTPVSEEALAKLLDDAKGQAFQTIVTLMNSHACPIALRMKAAIFIAEQTKGRARPADKEKKVTPPRQDQGLIAKLTRIIQNGRADAQAAPSEDSEEPSEETEDAAGAQA